MRRTYNSGSTGCDRKPTKEERSPDDAEENNSSSGTVKSPVERVVDYLCRYKRPRCLIVYIIQVAWILDFKKLQNHVKDAAVFLKEMHSTM